MLTRTRKTAAAAALALPLALLGCAGDEGGEELAPGGVEDETQQFDQTEQNETGDEQPGEEASEEGDEESATAPQTGAED